MTALRHTGTDTGVSASAMRALLQNQNTMKVTFFATRDAPCAGYNETTDGAVANLPLVAALAEYRIPGFPPVQLVFDGLFLTRVRIPRSHEVDGVLAEAIARKDVYYAPQPVEFTSSLPPEEAAALLAEVPSLPLNEGSVSAYVRLLGGADI